MFDRVRYIAWVHRFYGKVPFDLASSGIPSISLDALNALNAADSNVSRDVPLPNLDDANAYSRLRTAIARYNNVDETVVVPALGTSHAIFLAYASVLSAGDEVLVETPGYEPLHRAAEGLGTIVRTFERVASERFALSCERIESAMTPRTKLVVVTNLHNPTGVRADDTTLRELARRTRERGAYLLVDEVYAPFDSLADDGVFRGSAALLGDNVIAISSLTKCYGLGMDRIGWVLAAKPVAVRAEAAVVATCGHLPLAYAARAAFAFEHIGRLSRRTAALMKGKRELAARWAETIPGATWSAPDSGLFGMMTFPDRGEMLPLIEAWATEEGVLVGAATFFGVPNAFRLSWATLPADRFEQGLERLAVRLRDL
jgi:aspartate/methionine/tyrosine aminotransferase